MRFRRLTLARGYVTALLLVAVFVLGGCAAGEGTQAEIRETSIEFTSDTIDDAKDIRTNGADDNEGVRTASQGGDASKTSGIADLDMAEFGLDIVQDFRPSLDHGPKPVENQRYIVLHDTEGDADAASTIDWWDSNGNLVASHFVINKDGSIVQAVPLDRIAHHAGYGDAGHNELYGITEDGRDDMRGAEPIGSWAPDYGMNAWSVGIELVHTGGSGDYPQAQLQALDKLIAFIDRAFGTPSTIIDHKAWRSGNSDTSPEFISYLENYQATRTHSGFSS